MADGDSAFCLAGWLHALNTFGRAFGNSPEPAAVEIGFIALVAIWFVFQVAGYLRRGRSKPGKS